MSELSKLRLTVFPNGLASFLVDSNAEIKTANYTVAINTDAGKTLVSTLDAIVYTLPSIAIGNTITFVNMADDGQAALNISPAAVDGITYAGSAVDDKDLILTASGSKVGDRVTLLGDGSGGWVILDGFGNWAFEAQNTREG